MDKEMIKRVCKERLLPIVEFVAVPREHRHRGRSLRARCRSRCSSSRPTSAPRWESPRRTTPRELEAAFALAAQYDRKVIVERAIAGREFECAVLGNEAPVASLPCEILPSREFYDYDDKYLLDRAADQVPADLPPETTAELRRLAVECYRAVECEGMARVDFLLETATGKLYINEINTIPGFTSISMYPKMWEHSGIAFPALLDRLIELALERAPAAKATRFTR